MSKTFRAQTDLGRRNLTRGLGLGLAFGTLGASFSVQAQAYPARPIRWIVPYAPGGGVDTVARLYAAQVEKRLGQPIVVDNRPGGATIIGVNALKSAPADGYTVFSVTDQLAINPYLLDKVPYALDDFVGVSVLAKTLLALVSRPDYPARTAAEAIELIKTKGDSMSYGSWGVGGTAHLAMEAMLDRLGSKMVHVPFAGALPSINTMIGGQLDIMFTDLGTVAPFVRAGRLKLWAVGSKDRHPSFPDTPSVSESGLPGYDWFSWTGVLARRETPQEALGKLNEAIIAVGNSAEFKKEQLDRGNVPWNSTAKELDDLLRANAQAAKEIIGKRNIRLS